MNIGIDLGGTNIRLGVIENASILKKECISCPSYENAKEVLNQLKILIKSNINKEIKGIGIGVPSVVDVEKGIVYNVTNIPSWKEIHLKDELESSFSIPVFINNDSNCFALGENLFGKGINFQNIVGVTIGTGLGAGIIIHKKLYAGRNAGAGEIGSLPYLKYDFEHYCSSHFFKTYYEMTAQEAAQKATLGETGIQTVWNEFGHHIGEMIKAILYTYDPDVIIIGGGISSAFNLFEQSMWN